jgi:hypothetical protein
MRQSEVNTVPKNTVLPRRYYVYALIDPRTDSLYYVGLSVNPDERFMVHKREGRKPSRKAVPVYKKTNELLQAGVEPRFEILDELSTFYEEIALRLEACWRVEMLRRNKTLENSWDTGLCVDHSDPMGEAAMIKTYALASDAELARLKELDIERAFKMMFD